MDYASWRIDHFGIGVADIGQGARFYGLVLATIGLKPVMRLTRGRTAATEPDDPDLGAVGYGSSHPIFWIDVFHPTNARHHIGFRATSRAEVDAFHAAALAAGGGDNGAPGLRGGGYPAGYYAAFVFDPDGNNIEAVFRESGSRQ